MKGKAKQRLRQLEIKVDSIHRRLRTIEADLDYLPTITSFDNWDSLLLRDKAILHALFKYEQGVSTLQVAKDIGLPKPETSGRVMVLRRLYRIQEISTKIKGWPLVVRTKKGWTLNREDFTIILPAEAT